MSSKRAHILGVDVDLLNSDQLLEHIHQYIDEGTPHQLCTVNTEFVMEARRNRSFMQTLHTSDLNIADGAGIILAAQLLRQPIPTRIPGADFVQSLAAESSKQGYRIYLLGGRGGVGEATAKILTNLNPGLQIVGTHEGAPDEVGLIERIKATKPHILLVAWGAPKQDIWINQHKAELGVPVMMGVGGTFDFLVGKQKRAPRWMRQAGLEWLWRLVLEPSRIGRQLALPQMFIIIFWRLLTGQTRGK